MFLLGGAGYVCMELAWRGTSHWTMFMAGGVCLCYLDWISGWQHMPLLLAALIGAAGVTAVELVVGLLCTRVGHLHVWDYSGEWGNLAGLICPKYTALWFCLCFGVLWAMQALQKIPWNR